MIVNFLKQFPYTRKCGKGKTLMVFTLSKRLDGLKIILRKKVRNRCSSSVFSSIRTEYGEVLRIYPYSVRMLENTRVTQNTDTFHAVLYTSTHFQFSVLSHLNFCNFWDLACPNIHSKTFQKKSFFSVPVNKRFGSRRDQK